MDGRFIALRHETCDDVDLVDGAALCTRYMIKKGWRNFRENDINNGF